MSGRHALLIGNSTFVDPALARLSAPENDVIALRKVLENPEIAEFKTSLCLNAGLEEVRTAIADLFQKRAPDDTLLLYYTGHGLRDKEGRLFLALPGTIADAPSRISIEARFIRDEMDSSAALRQILILDCCHSGAFKRDGAKSGYDGPLVVRTDFDQSGHGRYVLAASSADQSAFEVGGRSIFTRHLVEALETGAAAVDRETVTLNDLHAYVSRRVSAENSEMRPVLWVDQQTDPLIIARNPDPRKPLPDGLVALLRESDPYRALGGATQLLSIAKGKDARMAEDAQRVLRERLQKLDDLSALVADKIREGLDPAPLAPPDLTGEVTALGRELQAERDRSAVSEQTWAEEREQITAKIDVLNNILKVERNRIAVSEQTWAEERKQMAIEIETARDQFRYKNSRNIFTANKRYTLVGIAVLFFVIIVSLFVAADTGWIQIVGPDRIDPALATSVLEPVEIAEAQSRLTGLGLYSGPLNGVANPDTEAAVRKFQGINRLTNTGHLNSETMAALRAMGRAP